MKTRWMESVLAAAAKEDLPEMVWSRNSRAAIKQQEELKKAS